MATFSIAARAAAASPAFRAWRARASLALGVAVGRGQDRVHQLLLGLVGAQDRVRERVVGRHHLAGRRGRGRLGLRRRGHQERRRHRRRPPACRALHRRLLEPDVRARAAQYTARGRRSTAAARN